MNEALIIKVGTSTLVQDGQLDTQSFERIGAQINQQQLLGRQAVIVSSAARKSLPHVGWQKVVDTWQRNLDAEVQSFLLTDEQLNTQDGCANVFGALRAGRIAVVNADDARLCDASPYASNDLVGAAIAAHATQHAEEVQFGMLSDIPGVLADLHNPSSVIPVIADVAAHRHLAGQAGSAGATGGMATKFDAAAHATSAGVHTWIAHGREANVIALAIEKQVGTSFKLPSTRP